MPTDDNSPSSSSDNEEIRRARIGKDNSDAIRLASIELEQGLQGRRIRNVEIRNE